MIRTIKIMIICFLFLSVYSVKAQIMYGAYRSEDGGEVYSTLNGNILTVIDDMVSGLYVFSGSNENFIFYSNQFLGIVSLSYDTKSIVVNSIPKNTSVTYNFDRVVTTSNQSTNSFNENNNQYTNPNNVNTNKTPGHIEKVTCLHCKGSKVQESPSYGASYGLDRSSNTRCSVCGKYETHYHANCIPCQGKGYIEKYVP